MNMMDSQSDSEEDIMVYAEFEDGIDIKQFRNINVIGINETKPIAQMDETHFTGAYEVALGTYMFFEEDNAPECSDPLFDKLPEKNLKYVGKASKLLKMKHAYVTSREDGDHCIQNELGKPVTEIPNVKFKILQDALDKFKTVITSNTGDDAPEDEVVSSSSMMCKFDDDYYSVHTWPLS